MLQKFLFVDFIHIFSVIKSYTRQPYDIIIDSLIFYLVKFLADVYICIYIFDIAGQTAHLPWYPGGDMGSKKLKIFEIPLATPGISAKVVILIPSTGKRR